MNTQQLPQLSIGEALKAACNKIFQFNGRSRRSEFWWTALVVIIICAITHDTISWLMNLLMIVFLCQDSEPFGFQSHSAAYTTPDAADGGGEQE